MCTSYTIFNYISLYVVSIDSTIFWIISHFKILFVFGFSFVLFSQIFCYRTHIRKFYLISFKVIPSGMHFFFFEGYIFVKWHCRLIYHSMPLGMHLLCMKRQNFTTFNNKLLKNCDVINENLVEMYNGVALSFLHQFHCVFEIEFVVS